MKKILAPLLICPTCLPDENPLQITTVVHQGSIRIAWGWGDYKPECNLWHLNR